MTSGVFALYIKISVLTYFLYRIGKRLLSSLFFIIITVIVLDFYPTLKTLMVHWRGADGNVRCPLVVATGGPPVGLKRSISGNITETNMQAVPQWATDDKR